MQAPFILVLLASTTGAQECLNVAAEASRILGRPLRLAHVQVGPGSIILPTQEHLSEYEAEHLAEFEQAQTQAIRTIVQEWAQSTGNEFQLDLFEGDEWHVMRRYRSKASLVILASPHTQPLGHREALRAALLRSGQPVMMIPPDWSGECGRRLLVGWEDVLPLRRAIDAFSAFLSSAVEVEVVAVNQDESSLHTARSLIDPVVSGASYRLVDSEGRKTATVLLDEACKCRSDGIVMGAFRRGEILNWLVPGTSSRLIRESSLPLLMSP